MKKLLKIFLFLLFLGVLIFFLYLNNTSLADPITVGFYKELKDSLKANGYATTLLVISTKRFKWHNSIQVFFSGAATKSKHLKGYAIDFLVFDVNKDGKSDNKDVDIVFRLLDLKIIKANGGIGTYKHEGSFLNKQMVHIDNRGYKARWNR